MADLSGLFALARRQHAAFVQAQAAAFGIGSASLTRLCRDGIVERTSPRIYVLAGAPRTRRQELVGHVLAAGEGALATGDSGLALWCPEMHLPLEPDIVVAKSCRYRPVGVRVRRSGDLHLAKPGQVDGIPVVGVARALLDAATGQTVEGVLSRIDACRRHLPLSVGALVECLQAHERRGRPGIATFRAALSTLTETVPDSDFERLAVRDLERAGITRPVLHHLVRIPGRRPIELDLAWPDHLLDVELDGRDHFTRCRTARRDRERDRTLQGLGYRVLRYVWADYVADPAVMVSEIAGLLATS